MLLLLSIRERVGRILWLGAALLVGIGSHTETDVGTLHQRTVVQIVMLIVGTVQCHLLDVAAFALGTDVHRVAILQMHCGMLEVGSADNILIATGAYGIET